MAPPKKGSLKAIPRLREREGVFFGRSLPLLAGITFLSLCLSNVSKQHGAVDWYTSRTQAWLPLPRAIGSKIIVADMMYTAAFGGVARKQLGRCAAGD